VYAACEERMTADKLMPCGDIHWLIPVLRSDKGYDLRRATWQQLGQGCCDVRVLKPDPSLFTRMGLNRHIISDHALSPYEQCLEVGRPTVAHSGPRPRARAARR
jgi:hypothetical protein